VSVAAATNHITTLPYDANGNLTNDGANALVYDAENRVVSARGKLDLSETFIDASDYLAVLPLLPAERGAAGVEAAGLAEVD
jgi:hypothetical protein